MSEKIYIKASVKKSKYGIKLSGKAEDVIKQIKENTNEKGYFNWNISERKEQGKYGETHYVTVDTWQPSTDRDGSQSVSQYQQVNENDLPF
jgi:hypothetical protein